VPRLPLPPHLSSRLAPRSPVGRCRPSTRGRPSARASWLGRAFNLSSEEVAAALADEDALIDTLCELFKQHGVSLTWVLTGTGPMVHDLRDDRP